MSSSKPDFESTNDNSDTWYDLSLLERNQIVIELIHNQILKAEPLLISPLLIAEDLVKETRIIIPDFTFPKEQNNNNNNRKSRGKYFLYINGTNTSGRNSSETFTDQSQSESNLEREEKNDQENVGRSNNGGSLQEKRTGREKCNSDQSTIHINFHEEERKNKDFKKSSDDDNEDHMTKIVKLLENNIDTVCRCGPSTIREYQFHHYFNPLEEMSNREAKEYLSPELKTVRTTEEQAFSNTSNGALSLLPSKLSSTTRGKSSTKKAGRKLKQLKPVTLKNIKRKNAVGKGGNVKPKSGKPKVINTERKSSFIKLPPISQRRKHVESDKDRETYRPVTKSIKILRNNDDQRNQKSITLPVITPNISSPPTPKVRNNSKILSANKGRFIKKTPLLYDISRIARIHELQESVSSNIKSKKGVQFQAVVPSSEILNTRNVKVSFQNVPNAKLNGRLPTHLPPLSPQIESAALSHTPILPVNTYKCGRKWLQPILNTTLNSFS